MDENKLQALAEYLGEEVEEGYDENVFKTESGAEYYVLTEPEAYEKAEEEIINIYDDMGLDSFTPEFQEEIISNAIDMDEVNQFIDNEIDYFENEEDDPDMLEYLRNLSTDEEKIQYLKDTLGEDEIKNEIQINKDILAEKAIDWDGIAHFIAFYDGNEIDLGDGLYAYRIN